jgi:3-deoxy-7-phosphoheptulonate synthase
MILHLSNATPAETVESLSRNLDAVVMRKEDHIVMVTTSKLQTLNGEAEAAKDYIQETFSFANDMQLSSREYRNETREVKIRDLLIGGGSNNTLMITGPCSIESEAQIEQVSEMLVEQGVKALRAGCYKPRTSPYSFHGLGLEGLKLLDKMRDKYGLAIVTEVRDSSHVDDVIEYADVVQIGTKAMYDQFILRRCGASNKPVLLKRGFGTTLQEFVQASEFILSGGNENVILCERGIRTFEDKTRFTLDICGAAWLKAHTNLPIIMDPSHAMGKRFGVPDVTRACVGLGVDGLLIETHPDPDSALSDPAQQLNFEMFRELNKTLPALATALGRQMI